MPASAPSALPAAFFQRPAIAVARGLIGAVLVRTLDDGTVLTARIVETEAYVGEHDLACHAAKGRTGRTDVMYQPGGVAYVYFIYGMYEMLNIVTGRAGNAQAVLLRAAEPVSGWPIGDEPDLSGPGKLTRALFITRALNGVPITAAPLHFLPRVRQLQKIIATPRIGVDYAGAWKDKPLRFLDPGSPAVSGKRVRLK